MADLEGTDKGFLARWSERTLEARDRLDSDGSRDRMSVDPAAGDRKEAPVLTDEDMPSLESLDEGSDYSGFLSPGVSRDLRRKALRKLFHGARLNVADGLDDYDEDFTGFLPLGDIVTSDMRHRMGEAKRLLSGRDGGGETPSAEDGGSA